MQADSTEIKVKSYNYQMRNLGIVFSLIFLTIGILMTTLSKNRNAMLCGIFIFILSSVIIIVFILISMIRCKHFDIYTENGFRHEYKGKIIYEVNWENVKSVSYFSSVLWNLIPQGGSSVLDIDFISLIEFNDGNSNRNHQHFFRPYTDYSVSNHISARDMRKVVKLIPDSVKKRYPNKII